MALSGVNADSPRASSIKSISAKLKSNSGLPRWTSTRPRWTWSESVVDHPVQLYSSSIRSSWTWTSRPSSIPITVEHNIYLFKRSYGYYRIWHTEHHNTIYNAPLKIWWQPFFQFSLLKPNAVYLQCHKSCSKWLQHIQWNSRNNYHMTEHTHTAISPDVLVGFVSWFWSKCYYFRLWWVVVKDHSVGDWDGRAAQAQGTAGVPCQWTRIKSPPVNS